MPETSVDAAGDVSIVHLVRAANGWEPFERFMRSYEAHPAGIAHRFVILLKGFGGLEDPTPYRERAAAQAAEFLTLGDRGFDVGSYWTAGQALSPGSLCFVNSFSVILDDAWLAKLACHRAATVGMVGASGSWESHRSTWIHASLGGFFAPLWRPPGSPPSRSLSFKDRGWLTREWLRWQRRYPGFPNPHLRTNAFIIHTDLMSQIRIGDIATKDDALDFESGWTSLTRQVVKMGLSVLVVGRDGISYGPDKWPRSRTYRSGAQDNLLVADKRTEQWLDMDPAAQEEARKNAWGNSERPGLRLPRLYRSGLQTATRR